MTEYFSNSDRQAAVAIALGIEICVIGESHLHENVVKTFKTFTPATDRPGSPKHRTIAYTICTQTYPS